MERTISITLCLIRRPKLNNSLRSFCLGMLGSALEIGASFGQWTPLFCVYPRHYKMLLAPVEFPQARGCGQVRRYMLEWVSPYQPLFGRRCGEMMNLPKPAATCSDKPSGYKLE